MGDFYKKLKSNGYKINLFLSTDENRLAAINYRENSQGFVQFTSEDFAQKAKMFFENFPTYF